MSPRTVEKKLKTAGVECLQGGIGGFAQKRQRDAEKLLMIPLQASPKSRVRVQVLGQFRQCPWAARRVHLHREGTRPVRCVGDNRRARLETGELSKIAPSFRVWQRREDGLTRLDREESEFQSSPLPGIKRLFHQIAISHENPNKAKPSA